METLDFTPIPKKLIFTKFQTWLILFSIKTGTILDLRNCKINAFITQNGAVVKRLKEGSGINTSADGQSFKVKNDNIIINENDTVPAVNELSIGTFHLNVVLTDSNDIEHAIANFAIEVRDLPIDSDVRVNSINAFEFDLKSISYSMTISASEFAQRAEAAKEDAETAKDLTIAAKTEVLEAKEIAVEKANQVNTLGFLGVWDASTNSPTLTKIPLNTLADGSFYIVETAGTQAITGISTNYEEGDQIRKVGATWKRIANIASRYPFANNAIVPSILRDAIIDVELVGRNPNKQYTIGIVRKNYNQSGTLKTAIRVYEWINGGFGAQSCVFQQDNYVPINNIERIKLTEETTGIYFFLTVDWSQIPEGTNLDTMGYNVAGLSTLCIKGHNSNISRSMLDSTIAHKNYPFDSSSSPNSVFQSAVKNIRIFCNDMSKKYTLSGLKKAASGTDWEIRVHESVNDVLSNSYSWTATNYVPKSSVETITLTSLFSSNTIEVDIDWNSVVPTGYNLTNLPFSISGISNLCYRPSLLKNNKGIVAGLGDSRIDMGDNNPTGVYDPKGKFTNKQNYGLMTWAEILCDRKMVTMGYNFGVSGDTSQQVLTRIESVLQANPDVCVVWAGMNDIAQSVALNTITSNLQKIYEKLLGRGIKVVAVLDNFATNFSSSQHLLNRQLNDWIRAYVEGRENVYLIDADVVVSSPTAETPTAKTKILYDTTHIGVRGAYYLGKQLAEILNRILPYKRTKSVGARDSYNANTNPNQIFNNLGFLGTGGTLSGASVTGIVPTGWVLSRSATTTTIVGSVTNSEEGFPEMTLVVNANAAEDKFSFSQSPSNAFMIPNTYFTLVCEIEVLNPIGLRSIGCWLESNMNNGTVTDSWTKGCCLDSGQLSAGSLNESFKGYFETPVLLSPATISAVNWITAGVRGQFDQAGGSATIKITKMKLTRSQP